ncbi:MAG: DUF6020 family protein [Candidatus Ancillula sp.]|nr:DUF6020 family protein [Candidatus Ancillula sp.]
MTNKRYYYFIQKHFVSFVFWVTLLILLTIMLVLKPPYAAYVDAGTSINMIKTGNYTYFQPMIYTVFLGILTFGGNTLPGSLLSWNLGWLLVLIVTDIIVSLTVAYCAKKLNSEIFKIRKRNILISFGLLLVINPYFLYYSTNVTKDILAAAILMLLIITILEICVNKAEKIPTKLLMQFIIFSLLAAQIRKNFVYALVILYILFLIVNRKKYLKQLLISFVVIILGSLCFSLAWNFGFHATEDKITESMAVPFQTVAKTMSNPKVQESSELKYFESLAPREKWSKGYIYDSYTKSRDYIGLNYLNNQSLWNKKEFYSNWIKLGLQNPGDYIAAIALQTGEYWNPLQQSTSQRMENSPKALKVSPILVNFGTYLPFYLLLFLSIFVFIGKKDNKMILILPLILPWLIWLSLLAGSLEAQVRLELPIYACLSILLCYFLKKKNKTINLKFHKKF